MPVWAQAQLGCADPEQIGDQQAKGGGPIVRYDAQEEVLLSRVGGEPRECLN